MPAVAHRELLRTARSLQCCWPPAGAAEPRAGVARWAAAHRFSSGAGSQPQSSSSSSSSNSSSSSIGGSAAGASSAQLSAAAAASAGAAARAAKAGAKQLSKLIRLVRSTSLLGATRLQLSSAWRAHSGVLTALGGAAATAGVYQAVSAAAGCFVDVSTPAASGGCLAASAAAVALVGLRVRAGFILDPDRVYQVAMRKLSRHAGLAEVMGSPLAGSDVRVQLVTRGGVFVEETLLLRRRCPRITMLFPLTGPLRRGVVSLEARKLGPGRYAFKTLAVELPDRPLAGEAGAVAAAAAAADAARRVAAAAAATVPESCSSAGSAEPEAAEVAASNGGGSASSDSTSRASSGGSSSSSSSSMTEPARIFVIGSPTDSTASSSSSSAAASQPPSPRELLEELKQPLVFALQQNLVVYEAEDELDQQLGWSAAEQPDPDQATLLDRASAGAQRLGCAAVGAARRAYRAAVQRLRSARSSSGGGSSSSGGGSSSSGGGAASSSSSTAGAQAPASEPPGPAPSAAPAAGAAGAAGS